MVDPKADPEQKDASASADPPSKATASKPIAKPAATAVSNSTTDTSKDDVTEAAPSKVSKPQESERSAQLHTEDAQSRKRDREGSQEPSAVSQGTPSTPDAALPVKKNRLIDEPTPSKAVKEAPTESGKVGQIRRRVEELSYDEREAKRADSGASHSEATEKSSLDSTSATVGDKAAEQAAPPPLPPRKAQVETATTHAASEKPAAETSKPAIAPSSVRTQPTFASFSSSSSPFSGSQAASSVSGPSWLAGSKSSSSSPFANVGNGSNSPKIGGMSGSTGSIKPSALGSDSGSTSESKSGPASSKAGATTGEKGKASTAGSGAAKASSGLGFGAFAASKPFSSGAAAKASPSANSSDKEATDKDSAASTPAAESVFDRQTDGTDNQKERDAEGDDGGAEDGEANKVKVQKKDEAELATGEEHEMTVHSIRAKLYIMSHEGSKDGAWKERGTGTLRVNVTRDPTIRHSGKGSNRLVMRAEGVLRLILNVALFPGMKVELAQDKFVRFVAMEDGKLQHFAIRVSNPVAGSALFQAIRRHIPSEASSRQSASSPPGSKAAGVVWKESNEESEDESTARGDEAA